MSRESHGKRRALTRSRKWLVSIVSVVALVPSMASVAWAHPGHSHFEVLKTKPQRKVVVKRVRGPVTFSSILQIKQSSSMEVWARFRFKAYYHLTITGKRNHDQAQIKRRLTFEIANDSKTVKQRDGRRSSKTRIATKSSGINMTRCKELIHRAMQDPSRYHLQVKSGGRTSATCRLINLQKKVRPSTQIAQRNIASANGPV
jgi:hypothetical protein